MGILEYLSKHPDAHDTAEGIAEWWLIDHLVRESKSRVKEALKELVDRGWLEVRQGRDARLRYQVNRTHQDEITTFVRRTQLGGSP